MSKEPDKFIRKADEKNYAKCRDCENIAHKKDFHSNQGRGDVCSNCGPTETIPLQGYICTICNTEYHPFDDARLHVKTDHSNKL